MSGEARECTGDAVPAPVAANGIAPQPATRAAATPHLLIVGDKSQDGGKWAGALRRAGYRVGIAADAEAGWCALDNDTYTLLITSQDAAGHTGLDLIQKVRAVRNQVPCILIWEEATPDAADLAQTLHPGAALEKPVTIAKLLTTVRELLRAEEDRRAATSSPSGVIPAIAGT